MRLGLFMMPLHPPTRDYHQMLEEDLEAVVLADRLGFDDVWVGEHFSSMTEPVTSPLTFLAKAIPLTKRVRLCTGVLNLPQQHPGGDRGLRGDVRPPGRRPLRDGHRPRRPAVRLRAVPPRGPDGARQDDPRIDRHDPEDLERRAALRDRGRVLADPPGRVALARARPRPDAQALPAAASADRGRRHEPLSVLRQGGGQARLAGDQRQLHPGGERRDPLAALQRGLRRGRGRARRRALARRAHRAGDRDRRRGARPTSPGPTARCATTSTTSAR